MSKVFCLFLVFFSFVTTLHAGFVYKTAPSNFSSHEESVVCLITHQDKHLVLLKNPFVAGGNLWTLPQTFLQKNESCYKAAQRLIKIELGFDFSLSDLIYMEKAYFTYPNKHVTAHIFRISVPRIPEKISLSRQEFSQYRFADSKMLEGMQFFPGEKECLELFPKNSGALKKRP